jgi:hypothetical protein
LLGRLGDVDGGGRLQNRFVDRRFAEDGLILHDAAGYPKGRNFASMGWQIISAE